MNMPSGMVIAMVNTPHALSDRALTNVMPSPAIAITRMKSTAIEAIKPVNGLISCLTMSGSDLPPRRAEAHKMIESCTAPARHTPATSQMNPGA